MADDADSGGAQAPDRHYLQAGQPPGLAAFADASAMLTSPRRFLAAELGAYHGLGTQPWLDCMVSVQELAGEFHFCIAHRWGELSPSSNDQFRTIATILTRQAIEHFKPEAKLIFHGGGHGDPKQLELIRAVNGWAKKFHFYRHLLPRRNLPEQFCRVEMTWDGARFIDPNFSDWVYALLPPALRAAVDGRESGVFFENDNAGPAGRKRLS